MQNQTSTETNLSAYDQLTTDEQAKCRIYWTAYARFIKGIGPKPEKNEAIQKYWQLRNQQNAHARAIQAKEFLSLQNLVHQTIMDPSKDFDMWGTKQLAEYFGVQSGTVLHWIKNGWLPDAVQPWSPNGKWYVPASSIEVMEARIARIQPALRRFYPRVLNSKKHQGSQGK